MPESEKFGGWIRTGISFAVWFVALLVLRSIILSLRAVQTSGFAVSPFQSQVFPEGLPWITIIDIVFLTIVILSVLAFGARLSDALSSMLPKLPRLATVGYLSMILVAVIIGYFTYDDIIVPPLYLQGVDWAYRLVFWLSIVGISLGIIFELAQTVLTFRRASVSVIRIPGTPLDGPGSSTKKCKQCGGAIDLGDAYCRWCGAQVQDTEEEDVVENEGATAP